VPKTREEIHIKQTNRHLKNERTPPVKPRTNRDGALTRRYRWTCSHL